MEDRQIVQLFWARDEDAIRQSSTKYGRMLSRLSYSLLSSHEDAEECVSDTYVAAWNNMPTDFPDYLGAYLSKIVRRISINRLRYRERSKRGAGVTTLLDELSECIPDTFTPDDQYQNERLGELLRGFVERLDRDKRIIFIKRYFSSESIYEIAVEMGMSEGKVKSILFRTRESLKKILEKEGLM